MSRAVAATLSPRSRAAIAHSRPKPREQPVMNQIFCVMYVDATDWSALQVKGRRLSSATHSTWWVIGNRSKRPQPLQPVAVLGEDRDVAGERGRVAGDVRDGPRRAVDDLLDDRPLGALARRVEHDQVERLVVRRREHPVHGPGLDRAPSSPRQVARGVLGRRSRSPSTATTRRPVPHGVGEEPGEQPDAGVQVEHRLPRLRARAVEHGRRPGRRARRGAPARSRRRRPRSRGRAADVVRRALRRLEQAVVDRHHVVRAVLAHPAAAVGQRRRSAAGSASAGRPRRRGPPRPSTSERRGRPAGTAARGRPSAFSSRCAGERRRAGSRSRRSSPGPAYGHGAATRSGDGLEHLDRVAAPEPVALGALGDLDDHPLPRQRVPDEDDPGLGLAVEPDDAVPAVRDRADLGLEPLADPRPAPGALPWPRAWRAGRLTAGPAGRCGCGRRRCRGAGRPGAPGRPRAPRARGRSARSAAGRAPR